MVGLDPTIHAAGEAVDPRVKPEDDVEGGVAPPTKSADQPPIVALRASMIGL
jgi:hypothetical protein